MRQYFVILSSAILMTVSACNNTNKKRPQLAQEIPTVSVEKKDIKLDHLYVSDIQAIRNVEIRSKVSGFLEAIYVDEGKAVKKGQALFKLSENEHRNEVAKNRAQLSIAQAEVKSAEVEYKRVQTLVQKNIISKTEQDLAHSRLNAAKSKVDEANSNLENALHKLSYTTIRAPYDGIIDRIPMKIGSLIEEGTLMTSVSDISAMYVYFNISENEYLTYKRARNADTAVENRIVHLVLSDGKDYGSVGIIETVVSEFHESTGSIAFRAKFPNPNQLLKHNATGKVKLTTLVGGALLVPQKAVFEIQDKNYVFVVGKDNIVNMRQFKPGGRTHQYYIVESGLVEGDMIVYEGIQNMKSGTKITPKNISVDNRKQLTAL